MWSVGAVYACGDSKGGDDALDKLHDSSAVGWGMGPWDDASARGGACASAARPLVDRSWRPHTNPRFLHRELVLCRESSRTYD